MKDSAERREARVVAKNCVPPAIDMADCVRTIKTADGITVHIMDTYCKNVTLEQKREMDTEIIRIYNQIMARSAAQKHCATGGTY